MRTIAGDRPPRYGEKNVLLTVGRGPVPCRASVGETALGVRVSRRSGARGGQAPALRRKQRAADRRARACPSPGLGRGNGLGWRAVFAQVGRSRGTGPRATGKKRYFTVGRGPVPRRASVGETALAGVRFSRRSGARGGQAPALRETAVSLSP